MPRAAILGGVTRISVARVQPGVVERRGAFQSVIIGELDGTTTDRVTRIGAAFRDAGVEARVSNSIDVDLWQKFVFLVAIAASCGLARSPVGPLRQRPLGHRLLERAVQEAVDVARARGISLATDETARVVAAIDALPPGTKPSFLLDLESGGPTELDILAAPFPGTRTRRELRRRFTMPSPRFWRGAGALTFRRSLLPLPLEAKRADNLIQPSPPGRGDSNSCAWRAGKAVRVEHSWLGLGHARAHDRAGNVHTDGRLRDRAGTE